MKYSRVIIFTCVLLGLLSSSISAGSISETYKYAWSDTVGYINFANVVVENDILSGYAWSKTRGWIKFDPVRGGVLNNGTGQLSGYAWGEHLGWINFGGVVIDAVTGRFTGTATGTLIGTLTFDCPQYCDVRTDWRPISSGGVSGGSGGGGGVIPPSGGANSSQPPSQEISPPTIVTAVTAFFKKFFREKTVTRLETVLIGLKLHRVPVFREYSCQNFYGDTVGIQVPWFTCQVVEKARTAQLISTTNTQFYPLRAVSRIEAYSILMKSICVHPMTTGQNWKYEVIKKAMELGFTVRNPDTFEPDRSLLESELYILSRRFDEYAQEYATCAKSAP